ncbi:MAG: pyridoxamine 5'-phosphate oxidase family protein [PVC group bacterium]
MKIDKDMERLLTRQNVVIVGTVNPDNSPNLSLKGLLKVDPEGYIHFSDLYRGKTFRNLKRDPRVSVMVFSIEEFTGFQFTGVAELIESGPLFEEAEADWQAKKSWLLGRRISKNVRKGFSHGRSEFQLPSLKALVRVAVERVYDLSPDRSRGMGEARSGSPSGASPAE